MEKIIKKDGYVYLVKDNDSYGKFPTYYNLGKDSDYWYDKDTPKPILKKKKKKEAKSEE